MAYEKEIYRSLVPPDTDLNREIWLDAKTSLAAVKICDEKNIAVIGIDGGTFTESGALQPDMELILDNSPTDHSDLWITYHEKCNKIAAKFLLDNLDRKSLVFTLVLVSESEYGVD